MSRLGACSASCMLLLASLSAAQPVFAQNTGEERSGLGSLLMDSAAANRVGAEVTPLVEEFWAAIFQRDSAAVVELIHPGALFVTAGVRKDREGLMADFAPWNSRRASAADSAIGFNLGDFRVIALSENAAIVNYVLAWNQVSPLLPSRLFDSHVWVRQDGKWKMVFAHDSVAELVEFLGSALERN